MNSGKIVVAALPIGGLTATEAASRFTRALRAAHPEIDASCFIQLPLAEGGEGTIDVLVTNTLGSFLEVEATGAEGEQVVVPLGFAGEDGKLAVIEMQRVCGSHGHTGSTYGVGELILDALDESAFSIVLGQEEPLAADAGFGAAQALGVSFYDKKGKQLDMRTAPLSSVERIDAAGRAFQLLSSRFFIAQSAASAQTMASEALMQQLTRLSDIIRRDIGIPVLPEGRSASAVEFGLEAFLSARAQDGMSLLIEASGILPLLEQAQCQAFVLLGASPEEMQRTAVASLAGKAKESVKKMTTVLQDAPSAAEKKKLPGSVITLADAKLFAAPVAPNASAETIRRDTLMRLEKLASQISI